MAINMDDHTQEENVSPLPADVIYFPALKAKRGELDALENTRTAERRRMVPILELAIQEGATPSTVGAEFNKLVPRLCKDYDATNFVIVDATMTDGIELSGTQAVENLHDRLRADAAAVPTLRTGSSADFIASVRKIAALDGNGVCIRLHGDDFGNTGFLASDLTNALEALDLSPGQVDLILDLGFVDGNSLIAFAGFVPAVIGALPHVHDWRSLVMLAGAFPQSLASAKPNEPASFPRYDAELWSRVIASEPPRLPTYGDYVTSYPVPGPPVKHQSAPNIRYTSDDQWFVIKSKVDPKLGNRTIFPIATMLRNQKPGILSKETFSWGDREYHRLASERGGPGGGTEWKAWSTSHHISVVIDRLARTGAP
ncbi:beta family protein (plasmid) [Rhodococcus opacus]|uniref:beta family protein n=1 Tax=Rhodococcus sp. ZPP TaxID=2749906 RepID=UPI00146D1BD7|nr:beta family protein [Rhodococcus sp. ZPP]QTJ70094.1 beta family protein [Rhodococcus sp. ZPP]WKN52378.1 beta family protein [Rhodococcus opacus]